MVCKQRFHRIETYDNKPFFQWVTFDWESSFEIVHVFLFHSVLPLCAATDSIKNYALILDSLRARRLSDRPTKICVFLVLYLRAKIDALLLAAIPQFPKLSSNRSISFEEIIFYPFFGQGSFFPPQHGHDRRPFFAHFLKYASYALASSSVSV